MEAIVRPSCLWFQFSPWNLNYAQNSTVPPSGAMRRSYARVGIREREFVIQSFPDSSPADDFAH